MNLGHSFNKQNGMTLIEVLVSLLIFSIGVLGMVALEARATQVSLDAEDRNRASVLANEAVSLIWTNGTSNLPSTVLTAWQQRVSVATSPSVGLPSGTGTITTVTTPGAPPVTTITIQWQEASHSSGSKVYTNPISQYTTSIIYGTVLGTVSLD